MASWVYADGDHLAFLPGGRGACSVASGCGTHRAANAPPGSTHRRSRMAPRSRSAPRASSRHPNRKPTPTISPRLFVPKLKTRLDALGDGRDARSENERTARQNTYDAIQTAISGFATCPMNSPGSAPAGRRRRTQGGRRLQGRRSKRDRAFTDYDTSSTDAHATRKRPPRAVSAGSIARGHAARSAGRRLRTHRGPRRADQGTDHAARPRAGRAGRAPQGRRAVIGRHGLGEGGSHIAR